LGVNRHGQGHKTHANDRVVEKDPGRECQVVDDSGQLFGNGLFGRNEDGNACFRCICFIFAMQSKEAIKTNASFMCPFSE
jgi:hypothetical protein